MSKESLVAFLNSRMNALKMLKVRDLALSAGIDEAVASRLLNVNSNEIGRYDTLIKVAKALEVNPGALFDAYAELPTGELPDPVIQQLVKIANQLSPATRKIALEVMGLFLQLENDAHNAKIEAFYDRQLEEEARHNREARAEKEHDAQTINEVIHRKIVKSRNRQDKNSA